MYFDKFIVVTEFLYIFITDKIIDVMLPVVAGVYRNLIYFVFNCKTADFKKFLSA